MKARGLLWKRRRFYCQEEVGIEEATLRRYLKMSNVISVSRRTDIPRGRILPIPAGDGSVKGGLPEIRRCPGHCLLVP